ncbi:MAG: hypothetical protein VB092_00670 [Oscillospiraceae bacterium]|nr:hypothetical protein [Oscillospiraceae bacterium]
MAKLFLRRLCAAALLLCVLLTLAACDTKTNDAPSAAQQTTHTEGADALAAMPASELTQDLSTYPAPDFLTQDQQSLYQAALRIYLAYSYANAWQPDSADRFENEKGWGYVRDAAFEDYDAFHAMLCGVFTDDYVALLESTGRYIEGESGGVYFLDGGVGSDITYIDCTYALKTQSDSELTYTITARYNDDAVFGEGGDRAKDYTKAFDVTLKNTDNGWRFDNFELPDAPGLA